MTTFETAKVGDKVWCMRLGWGEIRAVREGGYERVGGSTNTYPIDVIFPNGECESYTLGGYYDDYDITRSLFWDEVAIVAPVKPLPNLAVDAKVYVWDNGRENGYEHRVKRHFSHFENGELHAFDCGHTSWTGRRTTAWDNWELVEK